MKISTFLKGVNLKKLTTSIFAIFVFIFATDYLIHAVWLKSAYQATSHLWRPESAMNSTFIWLLLGQLIIAKFFTIVFVKGYEKRGPWEGVRFGFYMGSLTVGLHLINFAVMPIPGSIIAKWIFAAYVQSILAGVLLTYLYKK